MTGRPRRSPLFPYPTLFRSRYVHGPPIGRLPPIDAGATVVELASVASGPAVGERFVTHGASRWRRVGGKPIGPREARRSGEHTSEIQSLAYLVFRLLLVKKK